MFLHLTPQRIIISYFFVYHAPLLLPWLDLAKTEKRKKNETKKHLRNNLKYFLFVILPQVADLLRAALFCADYIILEMSK